jgi:hypothetical protein
MLSISFYNRYSIKARVMLTGAPGALVKETKKRKFCIENNTFYTF